MKKSIKIILLAIFIVLFLGITTSNAKTVPVDENTTAGEMLKELDAGNTLTGISDRIRDQNPDLYCSGATTWLYTEAQYKLSNKTPVTYPGDDSKNGYAKAYILAAGKYVKSDTSYGAPTKADIRQWAWYCVNGQKDDFNDLYNMAIEYQEYKNDEKKEGNEFKLITTNAKTFSDNGKTVYGPIQVQYSYANATFGEISDEWGGFDIAFYNGTSNVSENVTLCTKGEKGYEAICSSAGTGDNACYKIRSDAYGNTDLYVCINDNSIATVSIKVQLNEVNYTATVYELEGTVDLGAGGRSYCYECWSKVDNANAKGDKEKYYSDNGKFYVYDTTKIVTKSDSNQSYIVLGTDIYIYDGDGWRTNEYIDMVDATGLSIRHWKWAGYRHYFKEVTGCGNKITGGKSVIQCGHQYSDGKHPSQPLTLIDTKTTNTSIDTKVDIDIELTTSITITKKWDDNSNDENVRPSDIKFKVYRTTDSNFKGELEEVTDYTITWTNKKGNTWTAVISGLQRTDSNGKKYFFKIEEESLANYAVTYDSGSYKNGIVTSPGMWMNITNTKLIDIGGYVWLDEQTGIKPAIAPDGKMGDGETRLEGIKVELYSGDNLVKTTYTDSNGHYIFEKVTKGNYYVKFEYDGINYEDTIAGGDSKAFENDNSRNTFNGRFQTITYGKSNDGTTLKYNYANGKSTLITTDGNNVKAEFIMNAATETVSSSTYNLNLGLVKRETDIALSTDVSDAEVDINGQKTTYTYNKANNTIEISNGQTSENVSYNLNLYSSDYYYRIRDYVSNSEFKENDYINDDETSGIKTGDELKVYVKYALNLQNQSVKTVKVNEVKYVFDEKYTYKGLTDGSYDTTVSGNTITINLNGLELKFGETKTIYLLFEVNNNNGLTLGNFSNKAEITSYSTEEGLIDKDSQPGNFINDNQVEDDNDTAGGLTIKLEDTLVRKITGKVFDEDNKNVNDVIVQLIELKTVNGKVYEYIWQETVSGTGKGSKLSADGTQLEEYTYTKNDGTYEFSDVIPGDYIVRFIYGDGTSYDMTGNVIKYNGQDYKSVNNNNYNAEWYNSSSYVSGASVARDNEARRLETMAYSVNIDAEKGILLKLLDNVTLNETEKETLIAVYNKLYDPDITEVTTEVINKLLKEQTLKNTWMCAETSKIKVAVDTENVANTSEATTVNGVTKKYVHEIANINLGLEARPTTKIELKKYITGFKLTASNGQTLANASIDVNEYLKGTTDISSKVEGVKDNLIVLNNVLQYEVAPVDINTVIDGASLEFEYTLVVSNTGETDYLSKELTDAYKTMSISDYEAMLINKAKEIKTNIKKGNYNIGNVLGSNYYVGGTGTNKVLTEVTNIRDYVNNDLTFVFSYEGKVEEDENAPKTHRILRDDYSMQETTLSTILKTTEATGKMSNTDNEIMYVVTLGKNPISSTGKLEFDTYIAEVMSYTNSAGRRSVTSTPGNAEIIDAERREGKTHEIDEADTGRIQIGAATGEDEKTNYILVITVVGALALVAVGAVLVKKYVIK